MRDMLKEIEGAAQALSVRLQLVEARDPNDFDRAFSAMTRERARALIVLPSPMFYGEYKRIVDLATRNRLPAIYAFREAVDAGGLMSYGASLADLFRRAATYVDKILKGVKPADLPVEQPTKFELVVPGSSRATRTRGATSRASHSMDASERSLWSTSQVSVR
jgi:putative ABC transport system substrate-binding protein